MSVQSESSAHSVAAAAPLTVPLFPPVVALSGARDCLMGILPLSVPE